MKPRKRNWKEPGPPLQGTPHDKRRKLTEADKEDIKLWHRQGASIHSITKAMGVSRRLIQFVLFPERHALNLVHRAERGGSKVYYAKKKNTLSMRKHRAHKREVAKLLEVQNG